MQDFTPWMDDDVAEDKNAKLSKYKSYVLFELDKYLVEGGRGIEKQPPPSPLEKVPHNQVYLFIY